jgi:hypothetical protein
MQFASTSLEPCSTSVNCDGDEMLTVFDMLGGEAWKRTGSVWGKEFEALFCPATQLQEPGQAARKSEWGTER